MLIIMCYLTYLHFHKASFKLDTSGSPYGYKEIGTPLCDAADL